MKIQEIFRSTRLFMKTAVLLLVIVESDRGEGLARNTFLSLVTAPKSAMSNLPSLLDNSLFMMFFWDFLRGNPQSLKIMSSPIQFFDLTSGSRFPTAPQMTRLDTQRPDGATPPLWCTV